MKKCVITVVGKDTVGIIAKVCTYLAETGINILDISQTIIDDFFNMIMIVDVDGASKEFQEYTANHDVLCLRQSIQLTVCAFFQKFLLSGSECLHRFLRQVLPVQLYMK